MDHKDREKYVEDHYDDCGGDVSGIADDLYRKETGSSQNAYPQLIETDSEPDDDSLTTDTSTHGIEQFAFFGPMLHGIPDVPHTVELLPHVQSLFTRLSHTLESSADSRNTMLEICSCSDGSGRIAMRCEHQQNKFDALTTADFTDPQAQFAINDYIVV